MNVLEAPFNRPKSGWRKGPQSYHLDLVYRDSNKPVECTGGDVGETEDGFIGKKTYTAGGREVSIRIDRHELGSGGKVTGAIIFYGDEMHFGFEGDCNWIGGPSDCPAFLRHGSHQIRPGYQIGSDGLLPSEQASQVQFQTIF